MSIRVLIADDHKAMLDGLGLILEQEPDIIVVGKAENGRAAVNQARELKPDVVILDVTMPELNGIDATRQILQQIPQVRILALTMHADRRFVTSMLKAGAAGYLLKYCASDEIIAAVRAVAAHRTYFCAGVTNFVINEYVHPAAATVNGAEKSLTPRERDVLRLFAEGNNTRKIAEVLGLSFKTAAGYRQQIFEKLGIDNLADLTKYAIRQGVTTIEIQLSDREREILQLISEGKSTRQMAAILNLSIKTIETHRQHIMDKLKIDNVADLTKYAIREGLTSLQR